MTLSRGWKAGAVLAPRVLAPWVLAPLVLASAFSAGYVAAEAQKPEAARLAAAHELIVATGASRQFEAVVPMMVKQLEPILLQMAPGKEAEIKEITGLIIEKFGARKSEMMDIIASIYADKLDTQDMQQLSKFFSAGAGAAFIAKQPEILTESMAAGQKWGEKIGLEIEEQIKQELTKRGIKI